MVALLGGMAIPAKGQITEGHPWFGRPTVDLSYNPDRARRLLADAGFSRANPVRTKFIIAPSGSGQMQPLPMNELLQQNFRAVGIELEFEVMDWEALRARRRAGASAPEILVEGVIARLRELGARQVEQLAGIEETTRFSIPRELQADINPV
jgi:ABC-type transport system substrate-binding protein